LNSAGDNPLLSNASPPRPRCFRIFRSLPLRLQELCWVVGEIFSQPADRDTLIPLLSAKGPFSRLSRDDGENPVNRFGHG
jgi:hypothetical protein